MKKKGRAEATIIETTRRLKELTKTCNIDEPESVKLALANKKWANTTKSTTVSAYTAYLRFLNKTWTPPRYIIQEKIYFIPTETEIDQLIASAGKTTATLLQLLKETGARIGEATNLEWKDIDLEHKTVSINHPEKGSLPRILPISDKLKGMLNNIPKDTSHPFTRTTTAKGLKYTFYQMRRRTAQRLNNPRLLQIHFHTIRHWKATTEYYKTRDAYHVRAILGHRSTIMTDRYIHQSETLKDANDEWTCKVAHNEQEAIKLIETGFQYVNNLGDNTALYRKRK